MNELFIPQEEIDPGMLSAATLFSNKRSSVNYGNENEDTPSPAGKPIIEATSTLAAGEQVQSLNTLFKPRLNTPGNILA
jgi:hypothetical protein